MMSASGAGRAFKIDWKGVSDDVALISALEKPNVDWEFRASDLEGQEGTHRVDWFQEHGYYPQVIITCLFDVLSCEVLLQLEGVPHLFRGLITLNTVYRLSACTEGNIWSCEEECRSGVKV